MKTGLEMSEDQPGTDRFSQVAAQIQRRPGLFERALGKLRRALPAPLATYFENDPEAPITRAIARFAETGRDVVFVQIGSCDGMAGDPLHEHVVRHGWRGVVVEPVPANFERLKRTYANCPSGKCCNFAVASESGQRTFYTIAASQDVELPVWANQIGSFDRSHLAQHAAFFEGLERYIAEIKVDCLDFETLLASTGVERIDLLHTDVEGFDLEILKQVDFEQWRPRLVLFESFHMNAEDRAEAFALLEAAGYDCIEAGMNVLATRRS